jgi:hypothetical protein
VGGRAKLAADGQRLNFDTDVNIFNFDIGEIPSASSHGVFEEVESLERVGYGGAHG